MNHRVNLQIGDAIAECERLERENVAHETAVRVNMELTATAEANATRLMDERDEQLRRNLVLLERYAGAVEALQPFAAMAETAIGATNAAGVSDNEDTDGLMIRRVHLRRAAAIVQAASKEKP